MNIFMSEIRSMHQKFGVTEWYKNASAADRKSLLRFRMKMLAEEFSETMQAHIESDAEELIDGMVDMMVIIIGTMEIYGVDLDEAWSEVMRANLSKEPGVKPERPNPLGLPDLIKPEGWEPPYHLDNPGWMNLDRQLTLDLDDINDLVYGC